MLRNVYTNSNMNRNSKHEWKRERERAFDGMYKDNNGDYDSDGNNIDKSYS